MNAPFDTAMARAVVDAYEADNFSASYQRDVNLAQHAQWMLLAASEEVDTLRAKLAEVKHEKDANGRILADVNLALGRAGIYCAITFVEAIDRIRAERDDAIRERNAFHQIAERLMNERDDALRERDAAREAHKVGLS